MEQYAQKLAWREGLFLVLSALFCLQAMADDGSGSGGNGDHNVFLERSPSSQGGMLGDTAPVLQADPSANTPPTAPPQPQGCPPGTSWHYDRSGNLSCVTYEYSWQKPKKQNNRKGRDSRQSPGYNGSYNSYNDPYGGLYGENSNFTWQYNEYGELVYIPRGTGPKLIGGAGATVESNVSLSGSGTAIGDTNLRNKMNGALNQKESLEAAAALEEEALKRNQEQKAELEQDKAVLEREEEMLKTARKNENPTLRQARLRRLEEVQELLRQTVSYDDGLKAEMKARSAFIEGQKGSMDSLDSKNSKRQTALVKANESKLSLAGSSANTNFDILPAANTENTKTKASAQAGVQKTKEELIAEAELRADEQILKAKQELDALGLGEVNDSLVMAEKQEETMAAFQGQSRKSSSRSPANLSKVDHEFYLTIFDRVRRTIKRQQL